MCAATGSHALSPNEERDGEGSVLKSQVAAISEPALWCTHTSYGARGCANMRASIVLAHRSCAQADTRALGRGRMVRTRVRDRALVGARSDIAQVALDDLATPFEIDIAQKFYGALPRVRVCVLQQNR